MLFNTLFQITPRNTQKRKNKVGTFTMIFVRVAMSYMNYPRCGVCVLVGVYPFLKNAVLGIRVRVSVRVRVRVNPNPKTPFF